MYQSEPCPPPAAGAPQERCVHWRRQGQNECGGADGPHAAAPEQLCEGQAEEPAAPSQPRPRPHGPARLQSGNVLPAPQTRPGICLHCPPPGVVTLSRGWGEPRGGGSFNREGSGQTQAGQLGDLGEASPTLDRRHIATSVCLFCVLRKITHKKKRLDYFS